MGVLFCGLSGVGVRRGVPPQCVGAAPDFSLAHTIYGVSWWFKTLPVVYRLNKPPKPKQRVPGPGAAAAEVGGQPLWMRRMG